MITIPILRDEGTPRQSEYVAALNEGNEPIRYGWRDVDGNVTFEGDNQPAQSYRIINAELFTCGHCRTRVVRPAFRGALVALHVPHHCYQ